MWHTRKPYARGTQGRRPTARRDDRRLEATDLVRYSTELASLRRAVSTSRRRGPAGHDSELVGITISTHPERGPQCALRRCAHFSESSPMASAPHSSLMASRCCWPWASERL